MFLNCYSGNFMTYIIILNHFYREKEEIKKLNEDICRYFKINHYYIN